MIDVVIVNWNAGEHLRRGVNSLREFGAAAVDRVIVIDNGSTDLSLDGVDHPRLDLVRPGANLGFAKACNVGARRGVAPYVLFLNPDARIGKGTLDVVLTYMASEAAAATGICGVRLIDDRGETERHCAFFPTPATFVGQSLGLAGRAGFPPHFMTGFDHSSSRLVDQVIGAFFLVRRDVFDLLGGFDEDFFVYYEELDFALRAATRGWKTYYLAEATAFHVGGGTSNQVKAHRLLFLLRSRILFAFKHFSARAAWSVVLATAVAEPIARLGRAVLRGSPREAADTWRGFRWLWAELPSIVRHRAGQGRLA